MRKTFNIEIDCANCAIKCEEAVKKIKGINDCQISFITQKMTVESDDIDGIMKSVIKTIRKIEPDFEIID